MLERKRRDTIIRLLELHGVTSIHEVVEATGASESTIRRDFSELEDGGLLARVRGGVELVGEPPHSDTGTDANGPKSEFDLRRAKNQEKKRRIARAACTLISEGETIFVDGGSTTFHMVEFLASFSITVVTNSFAVANHLIKHSQATVILPEGTVDRDTQLILSYLSADPFENYAASKAFMGVEGITENELTNSANLVIQSERAMIAHARELIILADDSKFGHGGHLTLCPVARASRIITTKDAAAETVASIRSKGVEVIQT